MLLWKLDPHHKPYHPLEDLLRNLRWVLNSRKGFSSFLPQLGVGDYTEYQSREKIIETLLEELKENFQDFEPRVELLEIRPIESDLSYKLRFEIRCRLLDHDYPIYVIFDSMSSHVSLEMES